MLTELATRQLNDVVLPTDADRVSSNTVNEVALPTDADRVSNKTAE